MIKICQYKSEWSDVKSFCQRVKWGLLRVAGYVAWIAESSVVMSEMVEEEDDYVTAGRRLNLVGTSPHKHLSLERQIYMDRVIMTSLRSDAIL